jgi:hypothetical protein
MSTNPPSFRLPFALKDTFSEDVHPEVQEAIKAINHAIRYSFNGLLDLNQAIPVIKGLIPAATTPGNAGEGSGNLIGTTNDQTGNASYTIQNSDYGALVRVSNGGGVAVGLNSTIKKPFYTRIQVDSGSGAATLTPSYGTINNAGFISIAGGSSVDVYYRSEDNDWNAV